jgi:hypothetical protein
LLPICEIIQKNAADQPKNPPQRTPASQTTAKANKHKATCPDTILAGFLGGRGRRRTSNGVRSTPLPDP